MAEPRLNERLSSILKVIGQRAPSITAVLLSSRLQIKADMGTALEHTSSKYKVARAAAEKTMAQIMAAIDRRKAERALQCCAHDNASDVEDIEVDMPIPHPDHAATNPILGPNLVLNHHADASLPRRAIRILNAWVSYASQPPSP